MRLRHLFWIFSSCCRLAFICLPFRPVYQACAPYTIAGLTIAVYSSLVLIKHGPQVVAAIRERALKAAVPFPTAIFVYSFQFILGSSHTPSTLSLVSGLISPVKPSILIVLARSPVGSLLRLVKCIVVNDDGLRYYGMRGSIYTPRLEWNHGDEVDATLEP